MLGKLLNVLVLAMMLATLGWHYRDTDTVRQRRPLIERTLAKVGVDVATVRRHWPLEGSGGKGVAAAESASSSAINKAIEAYNLIPKVRKQLNVADKAQQQHDDALRQVGN